MLYVEIINTWINKVVLPYTKKLNRNRKFLLVWGRAREHLNEDSNIAFRNNNIDVILIPAGMTRIMQPLDISLNKSFKDLLREIYVQ